jgi:hypothetical protein
VIQLCFWNEYVLNVILDLNIHNFIIHFTAGILGQWNLYNSLYINVYFNFCIISNNAHLKSFKFCKEKSHYNYID